jgi:hypothetical protein
MITTTTASCISVIGCDRDHMVVWFTTTYAINAYHHWCFEFESRSGQGVQHYVIKCRWLATSDTSWTRTASSSGVTVLFIVSNYLSSYSVCLFVWWCLTPLSTTFQFDKTFKGKDEPNICSTHRSYEEGPSWPCSYGSWIYNYLCNQYLSPLTLWVRISIYHGSIIW